MRRRTTRGFCCAVAFARIAAGGTRKLDLGADQDHVYAGDATGRFMPAKPFRFLGRDR